MKKFKSNLIMFIVLLAWVGVFVAVYVATLPDIQVAFGVGIPLAFIYAMVCFFSKRVRSRMTVWWGILSLGSCVWWIYLLVKQ
jgi:hypothetical protein